MKDFFSIAIVGGGIIGCSIAYQLALRDCTDVILLEQRTLASGSSGRSDGIIERQFFTEFDILLRVKSFPVFRTLFEEKGVYFKPTGYLRIASDRAELESYARSISLQRKLGITDSSLLTNREIRERLPWLVGEMPGAILGKTDGQTDGYQVTWAFANEAEKHGVHIRQNTKVVDMVKQETGWLLETTMGKVRCNRLVNASGAWASRIAKIAGLTLPVKPVRRQVLQLEPPIKIGDIPFVIDMKSRLYFHLATDGSLNVGVHVDRDLATEPAVSPDRLKEAVDLEFVNQVHASLEHRAPALADSRVKGGWAGLYEITPDSRPIIGEHPDVPGLIHAIGFSGYGIQLSPIAGMLVSEIITNGGPVTIPDISPLSPTRFESQTDFPPLF